MFFFPDNSNATVNYRHGDVILQRKRLRTVHRYMLISENHRKVSETYHNKEYCNTVILYSMYLKVFSANSHLCCI